MSPLPIPPPQGGRVRVGDHFPKSPSGFTINTIAITTKMMKSSKTGKSKIPKEVKMPTMRAPTKAPFKFPKPPMTVMTNA